MITMNWSFLLFHKMIQNHKILWEIGHIRCPTSTVFWCLKEVSAVKSLVEGMQEITRECKVYSTRSFFPSLSVSNTFAVTHIDLHLHNQFLSSVTAQYMNYNLLRCSSVLYDIRYYDFSYTHKISVLLLSVEQNISFFTGIEIHE